MSSVEIYFQNDKPLNVYGSNCRFPKSTWEKVAYGDSFYYLAPTTYEVAITTIIWRAIDYRHATNQTEEFRRMIVSATSKIIDIDRGDGCSLMLVPFDEWADFLKDYEVPDIYKQ